MGSLENLSRQKAQIAERTLEFLKENLSNFEFAITGSYAEKIRRDSNRFNESSDIDIVVKEKHIKQIAKTLSSKGTTSIKEIKDYRPPEPEPPINPYNKAFSEYILKVDNLTPIHLIGSYKKGQEGLHINGIKYLKSKPPELLSVA